ncbi:MAG: type II toxin-antitoxin system VapC family toxin, partial [Deltaproteobacteria bacterium]|nr:type II toxin-antitoxin system VapC family toxin [Deltaproteobacteria bacterium]
MRFMLDTNICIYMIKGKPPQILSRLKGFNLGDLSVSSITLSELEYGVAKSSKPQQNRDALDAFLAPLEIFPFDGEAAYRYGQIRAFLEKEGKSIGAMDMLIGAHAVSASMTLVTNNTKE